MLETLKGGGLTFVTHTEYCIGACVLIIAAIMGALQAIFALLGVICFRCKGKCLFAFTAMFYTSAHLLRPCESELTVLSAVLGYGNNDQVWQLWRVSNNL